MHPRTIVEELQASDAFKSFRHEHEGYVLSTVFNVGEGWCVSYYSEKEDRMVTFSGSPPKASVPQEVFHKDAVEPLQIQRVLVDIEHCDERIVLLHAAKYNLHTIGKKFIVLHQHGVPEYNVTLITTTFSVINIKIDASTGELIKDSIESALAFKAKEEDLESDEDKSWDDFKE